MKYKDAGVDIDKGNEAVKRIKDKVKSTYDSHVLTELGSFGGLYSLSGYRDPVLVSGTDGVGTKLKIAFIKDKHDTVGIDLVAMSVNDILAQGARPLFFLDYIATSRVLPEKIESIVDGIIHGCALAGCALLGGETAEMPGFYSDGEYDLAGFAVGVCERDQIVTGADVAEGDALIGLRSSGLHSNGYSLARKALLDGGASEAVLDELLMPTRIYVKNVLALMESVRINGMVHVTGGGFYENIPRILNKGLGAVIKKGSWDVPEIFRMISAAGVDETEMFRTFNMGIGFILAVDKKDSLHAVEFLRQQGEDCSVIGHVEKSDGGVRFI